MAKENGGEDCGGGFLRLIESYTVQERVVPGVSALFETFRRMILKMTNSTGK